MRAVWLFLAIYAAVAVETGLGDRLAIGRVAPDVAALVAVVWLLVSSGPAGLLGAGAAVLAADLVSAGRIGVGLFWMMPVALLVVRTRRWSALGGIAASGVIVFVAASLFAVATALTRWILGEVDAGLTEVLLRAVGVGCYTASLSLPVLLVLRWAAPRQGLVRAAAPWP